jgi:accessory gene regulator B
MYLIEKVSYSLASKLASSLQLSDEQKSVIAYGATNLLQIIYCITLCVIAGLAFRVLPESLVVLFTVSLIRKYSGGIHSHSPNRCAVIGAIYSVGLGLIAKYSGVELSFTLVLGVLVYLCAFILVYKLAPVDSSAKPIKKEKTRLRLKKYSILALCCLLIISAILIVILKFYGLLFLYKYILCIYFGVIWQTFTLTKLGHAVLGKLDAFLDIKSIKGGRAN